jgi:hypothetical protein
VLCCVCLFVCVCVCVAAGGTRAAAVLVRAAVRRGRQWGVMQPVFQDVMRSLRLGGGGQMHVAIRFQTWHIVIYLRLIVGVRSSDVYGLRFPPLGSILPERP